MNEQPIVRAMSDLRRQAERRSGLPVDCGTLFLAVAAIFSMHRELVNSLSELAATIRTTR